MGLLDGLLGHGTAVDTASLERRLDGILIPGETARLAFKIIRDVFVFTERRGAPMSWRPSFGARL